jgi:hypothetical protein
MPGREPEGRRASAPARRPHAAPRRARQRLTTLLFALLGCVILLLSGIGLGTMGATVIGLSRLAELREGSPPPGASPRPGGGGQAQAGPSTPVTESAAGDGSPVPSAGGDAVRPALGIEVVDASGVRGARVVGVHVPGPGHTAGLVRGDVVTAFAGIRVRSATDLARAIATARPGVAVELVVRHADGGRQELAAVPGVVT